jgi:hypothetical protein
MADLTSLLVASGSLLDARRSVPDARWSVPFAVCLQPIERGPVGQYT